MHITVERLSYLYENEIDELMNVIKHTLRPEVEVDAAKMRSAVAFVRNGAVGNYMTDDIGVEIDADVQLETVTMRIEENVMVCSCPEDGWCAHRIAVAFHLYSQFNSLTDWMHEWRRTEAQQMMLTLSERTPEAWITVLTRLTNPLRTIDVAENPGVFIHESSMIDQKMIPLVPFEWEWKPLFELYYRMHVLDAGWGFVNEHLGNRYSSFFYGKWYVENWLGEQLGKLADSVNAIGAKPMLFEADAFHEQIKSLVRNFALGNEGLFEERFSVYRLFWQRIFPMPKARAEELAILAESPSKEARIFTAFFSLLQGQYEDLEAMTKSVEATDIETWLPLAHLAENSEDSKALSIIMHALLPHIGDYLKDTVAPASRSYFVRDIDGLLEGANFSESDREAMFTHYGESGVDVYADFLVERERFSEWAALMHRYSITFEEAEAGGLKLALSIDPAAVLPLLHIYAMDFIREKNRHSYRRAVKLFKKMKAGAKKSGKSEFWNRYIDAVREKNRRLRALMEEMEKGNLNL